LLFENTFLIENLYKIFCQNIGKSFSIRIARDEKNTVPFATKVVNNSSVKRTYLRKRSASRLELHDNIVLLVGSFDP